jgi:hypothetical protein
VIHGGDFLHSNILVQQAATGIQEFSFANEKEQPLRVAGQVTQVDTRVKWVAPDRGWVKANNWMSFGV